MNECRCFWMDEDGTCVQGEDPYQENCLLQIERPDVLNGKDFGPIEGPPQEKP